jgi:hypothetical protein
MDRAVYYRVADRLNASIPLHYEFLEQIARDANANPGDRHTRLRQRLHPYRARFVKGIAEELKRLQDRLGVPVIPVVLNLLVEPADQNLIDAANICEGAGLQPMRVFNAYEGHTAGEVYLSDTDRHPTPLGHRLIADEFYSIMLEDHVLGPLVRGAK